MTQARS